MQQFFNCFVFNVLLNDDAQTDAQHSTLATPITTPMIPPIMEVVYEGVEPEFQEVTALEEVEVKVPEKLRQKCEQGQCKRRKRVKNRGVIYICCDVVLVRGVYSCPSR